MGRTVTKRRFVLLDRDGTIIVERNYLSDPDQVELLPHAVEGLRRLSLAGLGLIIITNQSAIGRGMFDITRLAQIHNRLIGLLESERITLDGIYVCPHRPEDGCDCRKPKQGLVVQAALELGFDPSATFVIGDNVADIQLGHAIGATTILVRTGYGAKVETSKAVMPHHVVNDLLEAAELIVGKVNHPQGSHSHERII